MQLEWQLVAGGIGAALLARANDGVDVAAIVLQALCGAALRLLRLLLCLDLRSLAAHLAGTCKRSVNLTHGY
jgi:hypothetical protein